MTDLGKEGKSIRIGEYTIYRMSNGKLWIEHDSGEGMQCDGNALDELIANWYKENF